MPMINFTNPITVFLGIVLFILILFLGKETKKSSLIAIMLFVFILILIGHTLEYGIIANKTQEIYYGLVKSIMFDFAFIFVSFISYLWIDDMEAKLKKKKSIDNSLEWFWKKV